MYIYNVKIFDTRNEAEILRDLGLSNREALIYLAALQTGGGTITDLAEVAKIERTSIYYHLKRLLTLKLLKAITKGSHQVYIPADPDRLKELNEKNQKEFHLFFPVLQEQFTQHSSKSMIEFYQGKEELNKFYDRMYQILSMLKGDNNVVYILGTSYRHVVETGPDFLNFEKPKNKINVIVKTILPKGQKSKDPKRNAMDPYIVTRFNLPKAQIRYIDDKYKYPGAIVVTSDRVIQIDYKNMNYAITANKNLATTWRMFFEYIWNTLR
ncbi:MAG: transcriptional regulator TrmB [Candidatus Berkelbacteria bacterium]|nr:transcriptional regulator TrmB [Candidatus Berkelbacteria bacterium]